MRKGDGIWYGTDCTIEVSASFSAVIVLSCWSYKLGNRFSRTQSWTTVVVNEGNQKFSEATHIHVIGTWQEIRELLFQLILPASFCFVCVCQFTFQIWNKKIDLFWIVISFWLFLSFSSLNPDWGYYSHWLFQERDIVFAKSTRASKEMKKKRRK